MFKIRSYLPLSLHLSLSLSLCSFLVFCPRASILIILLILLYSSHVAPSNGDVVVVLSSVEHAFKAVPFVARTLNGFLLPLFVSRGSQKKRARITQIRLAVISSRQLAEYHMFLFSLLIFSTNGLYKSSIFCVLSSFFFSFFFTSLSLSRPSSYSH